ncbi:hypothetical protein DFQ28_010853 [Apophysomyces sp. BC1034]|nr:hypothetical protein DFQ30_008673 [Apophysomyces sp. BC1015]KAG0180048.1 hypothetical protein DFQ29_001311 [Apophysomyces sp. BC1021]KAG0191824.1 hypothetical protein DFQ28_010853 [Apophysomyces sp. BC1034]
MFGIWARGVARHGVRCTAARHASTETAGRHVAFEEALKLIQLDKKERLEMLARVQKEMTRVKKTSSPLKGPQLATLEALKYDLEVKAELNDPDVRRNFNEGQIDMAQPVYRYLTQKQFEKAPRSQLLERVTQMNVIPDLVAPGFDPKVQINIHLGEEEQPVEPGVFVKPEKTVNVPKINVSNFHTDTRLYTLMFVDPDSPDVVNQSYQQHCHWLITNVPLSATQSIVAGGDTVLDYVPPHPQKGTKYHRYTLIAYEQPNQGQDKVEIKLEKRDAFDTKTLAQAHGLNISGVSFFREEWDAAVSNIYQDILRVNEPVYGKPPKLQRYIQRATYF